MRTKTRKVVFWSVVLVLAMLAGGLGFAYSYVTDSATLAEAIRRGSPRYLRGSVVHVGRVQLRPLLGQVTLNHFRLSQSLDGRPFPTAQIAWMSIICDVKALAQGRFEPSEIALTQPVLRVRRRKDGTWNLQGLLADPWPAPPLTRLPTVLVKGGRLELIDDASDAPTMVLQDAELTAKPAPGGGPLRFEGSARGGPFDRVRFEGTYDPKTGRLDLSKGDLSRLALSDSLKRCLGLPDAGDQFDRLGLSGGEADFIVKAATYDPAATPALRYAGTARLRGATLTRDELPFRLSDVSATLALDGGRMVVEHAEGRNGKTTVHVQGSFASDDPEGGPLDLNVNVTDLELDSRLRAKTPAEYAPLWQEYQPEGWVSLGLKLVRAARGAPLGFGLTVRCQDVGMRFHLFPFPLQHLQGTLTWQGDTITVALRTFLSGEWLHGEGTIEHPGPDALVKLDFRTESMRIDETLLRAMPAEIRDVVDDFQPTGSVRGVAHLLRRPPARPGDPEDIQIHAELDLNEGCSMRWDGLPYLVRNLTGHLEIHPDRWKFTNMRGTNGAAIITARGEVQGAEPGRQKIDLTLHAQHLPFDQQLREALPPQWQATWATLNPSGLSGVDARITAEPGEEPHYRLTIVPEPAETRIHLAVMPVPGSPGPGNVDGGVIRLPAMDNVSGTFYFDDGTVTMSGVRFHFREAPVEFKGGRVVLRDDGGFDLQVVDLLVTKLRLDPELRKIMPPVMAQFAQRLDDSKTFWLRGDLGIGWSGRTGEPARCDWQNTTVVLEGNAIRTGLPLEDIQGQIDHLSGRTDGRGIEVQGSVNLASVKLLGLQVTNLESPLLVKDGQALMPNIRGTLLGGTVYGDLAVSLDTTPHYVANMQLVGADLAQYALTLPGRQNLRGLVSGWLRVEGDGNDLRTCGGSGQASVTQGDLGELHWAIRWAKVPNFRPPTKTAFDSAEVRATIGEGLLTFDSIKFTGDAVSLMGHGTMKLQGQRELDLRLSPLFGRDERRLPLVSDAMREASGRVFDLHVTGPLSSPKVDPEALPDVMSRASEVVRRRAERRGVARARR
jgi:hypothetical protein